MAQLKVFEAKDPSSFKEYKEFSTAQKVLSQIDIKLENWHPEETLPKGASSEAILKAFSSSIEKLRKERGFTTADVIALTPENPQKDVLREKFLKEHTHTDDEARYFVDGEGLFYVHKQDKVYGILCQKGDLINVPKGTKHWFDMGPNPSFQCIRVFTNEEGWVAENTGSSIAENFPVLEN